LHAWNISSICLRHLLLHHTLLDHLLLSLLHQLRVVGHYIRETLAYCVVRM
jgi:hypothetical protein